MSKFILLNLIRSSRTSNQTNCLLMKELVRSLSTRNDDVRLLKNFNKLSRVTMRHESDKKSTEPVKSIESIKEKSDSDESNKEQRFSSAPKQPRQFIFSWRTLYISGAFAGIYFGIIYYLKKQKEHEWEKDRIKSLGKAAIGGTFELVDVNNKPVSSKDFLGKWCLIYFGFSHCPDVCPEEMEKMVEVYHRVKQMEKKAEIVPLFISVDPSRDTPEVVKKYCAEFSPEIIGLTGSNEQVKAMCKSYRVYYSPGPKSKDKDYIVDHTIIIYLINPDGEFVDYYGQTRNADMIANAVVINMKKYNKMKFGSWFN